MVMLFLNIPSALQRNTDNLKLPWNPLKVCLFDERFTLHPHSLLNKKHSLLPLLSSRGNPWYHPLPTSTQALCKLLFNVSKYFDFPLWHDIIRLRTLPPTQGDHNRALDPICLMVRDQRWTSSRGVFVFISILTSFIALPTPTLLSTSLSSYPSHLEVLAKKDQFPKCRYRGKVQRELL